MRRVNAALGGSDDVLKRVGDGILQMSQNLPIAATELAKGAEAIAQMGEKDPDKVLERLGVAAKGAVITGQDLVTTTQELSRVMSAFGLDASQAQHVLDVFAKAGQSGAPIGQVAELVTALGAPARAAGVSLESLTAAVATFLTQGVSSTQIMRALRQTFGGIATDATTGAVGIERLGGSVTVSNGVLQLGGRFAATYAQEMAGMAGATGTADRVVAQLTGTAEAQYQLVKNNLNVAMIELGTQILPTVEEEMRGLNGLITLFNGQVENIRLNSAIATVQTLSAQAHLSADGIKRLSDAVSDLVHNGLDKLNKGQLQSLSQAIGLLRALGAPVQEGTGFLGATNYDLTDLQRQVNARLRSAGPAAAARRSSGGGGGGGSVISEAALARRNALQSKLDSELARLTSGTADSMIVAIDRLGMEFDKEYAHHIPAAIQTTLDQLGVAAREDANLESFAAGLSQVKDAVAALGTTGKDTGPLAQQRDNLQQMRVSLAAYVQTLQVGTAAYDRGQRLLAETDAEIRTLTKSELDALKAAIDRTKEYGKQHDSLTLQVRALEEVGRGALQVAEAFGLLSSEAGRGLEAVIQIASNIKLLENAKISSFGDLFSKDNLPATVGLLGGIGTAVSVLGGLFGDNPEAQRQQQILQQNNQALQDLTLTIKESAIGKSISGTTFAAAQGVLSNPQAFAPTNVGTALAHGFVDPGKLSAQLASAGITMQDLGNLAQQLGLHFAGAVPTLAELNQLAEALSKVQLTEFADTLQGKLDALSHWATVFDITDPIQQLQELQKVLNSTNASTASGALGSALSGKDLTTAQGRAAAEAALEALFTQLQGGALTAAQLGGLSPDQFLQQLEDALAKLRAADASVGGATSEFSTNRSITETTGSILEALLTTETYWSQQTAENTAQIAALLAGPGRLTVQPPTSAEMDAFAGVPSGGVTVNLTININGALAGPNAQAVGNVVADAVVQHINRKLGVRQRARAKALGKATVN
jgi:hypothetical protein